MRYSITLSYDGSAFCGWQIQPNAPSVQETLQTALGTLLGQPVGVVGAGRTDTGVNASCFVAHFDSPAGELDCSDLCYKLNAILPCSVAIFSIQRVADDFHARFDARRREYTYFLHRRKDPFVEKYSYLCAYPTLDFEQMNEAAQLLLGTHDFRCFEKTGSGNKTSVCTIFEAEWRKGEAPCALCAGSPDDYWAFHIAGDRFLRNMVRAIVGTLIEVGRGKRTAASISGLIGNGSRSDSGESVPGQALFLSGIEY